MNPEAAQARIRELFPAFRTLAAPLWDRVAREATIVDAPSGMRLFDVESPCAAFPLVLDGAVRVSKLGARGRELLLYRVEPGQSCVLTSSCLLSSTSYSATGSAEGPLRLAAVPKPLFDTLMAEHPPFRAFVFALFSERILELMMLVEEVAFMQLDQRLATALLERGPRLRTTHQALADELGSVREIVGRVLRGFEAQGLVALSREMIEVVDADGLRRITGS